MSKQNSESRIYRTADDGFMKITVTADTVKETRHSFDRVEAGIQHRRVDPDDADAMAEAEAWLERQSKPTR